MGIPEQVISKIDPNTISLQAYLYVVTIFGILFLLFYVWPWFRKDHYPKRAARIEKELDARLQIEKDRNSAMMSIRDTMLEIGLMTRELLIEVRGHDSWTRAYAGQEAQTRGQSLNDILTRANADKVPTADLPKKADG